MLQFSACISDVSAAQNYGSLLFPLPEEMRVEASTLYLSEDKAHLFQSRCSSCMFRERFYHPLDENDWKSFLGDSVDCVDNRLTLNAAWPETFLAWLTHDECRDPLNHKGVYCSQPLNLLKGWDLPLFWSRTELKGKNFITPNKLRN